ncbi:GNAT family N-acetyltransferase [Collimonas humicola]|uniref:GNAT family N-acetyltransferase n=1 Tax=Collimonas humicola TaxID=2825886 RepID=UPI001B8D5AC9|nr:hypothetical protein [Collimonas humicola]
MDILPLATERLLLRSVTRDDAPVSTSYRNQPEVARYQSLARHSAADAAAFLEQQRKLAFNIDDTWLQIATKHKEDTALAGDVAVA